MRKNLSIICPVYNEEKSLKEFFKRIIFHTKKISNIQIVFIDDGSDDKSLSLIKSFSKKNNKIKYISFNRNYGHQSAILAGLENFDSNYYLIMDTDLQHDPKYIGNMYNLIQKKNTDLVQMSKTRNHGDGIFKFFTSKIFYKIFSKLNDIQIDSGSSDFYIFTKSLRDKLINISFGNNFLRGSVNWLSKNKVNIPYETSKRFAGKSSYTLTKQLLLGLPGLINFGSKLYLFFFKASILIAILCLSYIGYIFYDFFNNGIGVEGWNSTIVIILFFGALQVLFFSIILYILHRIYILIGKKPDYIIRFKNSS